MMRYLKNLFLSLLGYNPYQKEIDELNEKIKAGATCMRIKDVLYDILLGNCESAQARVEELCTESEAKQRQINDLQALVEILRKRIREKNDKIQQQGIECRAHVERIKSDYQQRILAYNEALNNGGTEGGNNID